MSAKLPRDPDDRLRAVDSFSVTVAKLFGANAGLGRFVQYYADCVDCPRRVTDLVYSGVVALGGDERAGPHTPACAVLAALKASMR